MTKKEIIQQIKDARDSAKEDWEIAFKSGLSKDVRHVYFGKYQALDKLYRQVMDRELGEEEIF